ncbi:MAG: hypothetical protein ACLFR2_09150 [Candidatus Kapaibacterium sp.]
MAVELYICEKCGRERQVMLDPGETTDDITCACKKAVDNIGEKKTVPEGLNLLQNDDHSCGCGGSCGCN